MSSHLLAVAFDATDPAGPARFWAELLGRDLVETARGALLAGDGTQLGLRFSPSDSQRVGPNRMHLHLTSRSDADQQETVAKALRLGGQHLDVGQLPEERHVVLADPGGNAFCVIEAGNSFLAGCGLLGELSCDGARDVGVFWAAALDWPLVWDRDEETAVQSPQGGTKVSWGGPPVAPLVGQPGERLQLVADDDLEAEAERLVALGARRLARQEDGDDSLVVLADPGGNEFHLLTRDGDLRASARSG